MAVTKFSLRLLVDTHARKVLFAEVGGDFIDFVFSFLPLPLGTVTRLLSRESMVGCIGNLYRSVENLNPAYMQHNQDKDSLLKPQPPASAAKVRLFYCANHCLGYVSDDQRATCPECGHSMSNEVLYLASGGEGDYVKGSAAYLVMDDLSVMPNTSGIAVLKKCNVKQLEGLQEKVVEFGSYEGLELLEASFRSKAALSYVFFGKEEFQEN